MDNEQKTTLYNQWLEYRQHCMVEMLPMLSFSDWLSRPPLPQLDTELKRRLGRCALELGAETQRCADLSRQLGRCVDALCEIASEDYRGPKPASAYIAERALKLVGGWRSVDVTQ